MRISVYEVGLRDGLQNEEKFVETDVKIALAGKLAQAGLSRIELTSFVSSRWIPQLADHDAVAANAPRIPQVQYSALVPNMRGLSAAQAAGLSEIAIFMSASESHSASNINKSIAGALASLEEVARSARAAGLRVRAYLSTAFGCPFEGRVDEGKVAGLAARLIDFGAYEVSLGDTIGVAHPRQVARLVARVSRGVPHDRLALHLHDTHGVALANVLAGLDAGITTFDSALGGLGGCPYAPGASGNLATEDLVYMLREMDCETGVDLEKLVEASEFIAPYVGHALTSKTFYAELARREPQRSESVTLPNVAVIISDRIRPGSGPSRT